MKGIRRQKRGDKIVRYHRAIGIRLPDLPETHPHFIDAWARAEAMTMTPMEHAQRKVPVKPGQIAADVRDMLNSAWFRGKSPTYKGTVRRHAEDISSKYGPAKTKAVTAQNIEADLGKLDPNPANDRLKVWRALMARAKVAPNPALEVKRREVKVIGFAAWDSDEIAMFRARWPIGTAARGAFEMLYWSATRTNDAVTLGPGNVGPDGILTFVQIQDRRHGLCAVVEPPARICRIMGGRARAGQGGACGPQGRRDLPRRGGQDPQREGPRQPDHGRGAGRRIDGQDRARSAQGPSDGHCRGGRHVTRGHGMGGHASLAEVEHHTRAAKMRRLVSRGKGRN